MRNPKARRTSSAVAASSKLKRNALLACLAILVGLVAYALIHLYQPVVQGDAQWYASAQRLDPTFAIDGTDPDKLRAAVDALFSQAASMADGYDGTKAQKDILRSQLYPAHFLVLLPQLQAARDALLSGPTPQSATRYHNLLLTTIDAYVSDAHAWSGMMRSAEFRGAIGFMTGTTTPVLMADRIDGAAQAALAQKSKEQARFDCYRHWDSSCGQPVSPTAELKAASDSPASSPRIASIDAMAGAIIRHSYPDAHDFSPLLAISTDCFPYPTSYLRTFEFELNTGGQTRKAYLANDAFFYDLSNYASSTKDALDRAAFSAGNPYEYQNMANNYMCPDIGLYMSDLSRIVGLYALAQATSSPAAERLRALPYLTLAGAAAYARDSGDALAREEYLEGSAQFDENVQALTNDNYYVLSAERHDSEIQFPYFLVVRSYPSVLFLLGNPTFVPGRPSLFSGTVRGNLYPSLHSWNLELSRTMATSTMLRAAERSVDFFHSVSVRSSPSNTSAPLPQGE